MEGDYRLIKALTITVILLAAFTAILYVYPSSIMTLSSQQSLANGLKLQNFLSAYRINLTSLSERSLYYFYGALPNNSIVFGCNYEMLPAFPSAPLDSALLQSDYNSILRDMALSSMCSVENATNCSAAYAQLHGFMNKSMNSSQIKSLFDLVYSEISGYYGEIVGSGFGNSTIAGPVRYDVGLFNSSKNSSARINALLKMKQMPVNIVFDGRGKMLGYSNETAIYGPFQFQVYKLINATVCGYSNVFNVVIDPSYFSSPSYRYIYDGAKNVTNVCIVRGGNACGQPEMKNLNMSFYAN